MLVSDWVWMGSPSLLDSRELTAGSRATACESVGLVGLKVGSMLNSERKRAKDWLIFPKFRRRFSMVIAKAIAKNIDVLIKMYSSGFHASLVPLVDFHNEAREERKETVEEN